MKKAPFLKTFRSSRVLKGCFEGAVSVGSDMVPYCIGKAGDIDICCSTKDNVKLFTNYTVKITRRTKEIAGSTYFVSEIVREKLFQRRESETFSRLLNIIKKMDPEDAERILYSHGILSKKRLESAVNSFPSLFI